MNKQYDAIVIGAGHNGLVCAAYLARGGYSTLVIEANKQVGGMAGMRELAPGYAVPACAHLLFLPWAKIMAELSLERHGLRPAAANLDTIALDADGNHLILAGNALRGGALAAADRAAYAQFQNQLRRFAKLLQKTFATRPPRLASGGLADLAALAKLGLSARLLGRDDMRELLRIGALNIHDLLRETFADERLQGVLGFDAVLGNNLGPRSPGTVLTYLHRLTGQAREGGNGVWTPAGGMGALAQALRASAAAAGAEILTGQPARRVLLERDRAVGVETASGRQINSPVVVSNADPKTTFLKLVGARHLETGFVRRVNNIRMGGKAAKLHLALDGVPVFKALADEQLGQRLVIAPSLNYVERAFDSAKYGECSPEPVMEITIPSARETSLAPKGKHVLSAIVQCAPYDLRGGWEAGRAIFRRRLIDKLVEYAPGIREQVTAAELLAPPDLEQAFNLHGGHWHHGEYSLDQFMMLRPAPGAAQYATPVAGLYLCGAGAHPGGGVMGLAGRNAAAEIMKRERRR